MNDLEHAAIVRLGIGCLPEGPGEFWKPLKPEILGTCMLPDQMAIPLLRGSKGPWRKYFPPNLRFNFEQTGRDARTFLPAMDFYIRHTVDCIRRGDLAEAAKFVGVFSHYLGDFTQPAHYYELDIGTLLPPPKDMRNCEYHRMIESIPNTVKTLRYRPRILGASPGEMKFRIEGRLATLFRRSVAAVIPMVQAIYRRQNDLATKVLNPIIRDSARLLADFCCSVLAIAHGQFSPADLARLATCDLREIEPSAHDVEFNFGHKPLIDMVTCRPYGYAQEIQLRRPDDPSKAQTVKGVCLVPHALPLPGVDLSAMLEYRLPTRTFSRFEARVGLLATEPRQAVCKFDVLVDGRRRFTSGDMGPEDAAREVSVDVTGGKLLRLFVRTDGSTDKLAFAIWGEPRLWKASHAHVHP